MKVKDLLKMEIDIDVYDNVCEELGIAFCGPMELTEEGKAYFAEPLEYEVEVIEPNEALHQYSYVGIVDVDDEEEKVWQKKLDWACKLFWALAGYCDEECFKSWFKESDDGYEDNHCFPQEVRDIFDDMENMEV